MAEADEEMKELFEELGIEPKKVEEYETEENYIPVHEEEEDEEEKEERKEEELEQYREVSSF